MKVIEKQMVVSMEPQFETEYLKLMNEYFAASERNSRSSSIQEKKQMMAIKDKMALLCNRNPEKLKTLKTIIKEASNSREKTVVITKSNIVAAELADELTKDEAAKGVLQIATQLSIHGVNEVSDRFNKIPESTVLIVTDAVSTGIDLTAANHLVHYDYPARYTDILQRNNRITRQTSHHPEVTVYYLVTSGKIDEFDYRECMNEKANIDIKSTV
ncbi:MAG: hypothetical protein JWR03_820 [Cohnella sp.]|nr:hypothetical protein [Cohnella sp.]